MKPGRYDLAGKTALVTGASSGLGTNFAQALAKAGANVVLAARRVDRLEDLRGRIEADGGKALAVELDVADEPSTQAAYDRAEAAFGTVDIVVANAGIASGGSATDLPMQVFDDLIAINLRGVFITVREAARRLITAGSRERENGRIIIISSILGEKVSAGSSVYAASKAGVLQMGRVLARDWAREGISVNMILPGYITTEMTENWLARPEGQKMVSKFPRKRVLQPSDLEDVLLLLASDAGRAITGAAFTVDDGQSL